MTFEQFQDSRLYVTDLAKALPDTYLDTPDAPPAPGYVYCGSLMIEEVQDHWPDNARARGQWYLLISNWERISDDLSDLERHLYEYAQGEGIA